MGERDAPECSWKKMVIAKSNNAWVSTIKTEHMNESSTMDTTSFSLGDDEKPLSEIKSENTNEHLEVEVPNMDAQPEVFIQEFNPLLMERKIKWQRNEIDTHPEIFIQELNPLLVDTPITPRRRKAWGPKRETSQERAVRLAKMSAYAAQRIANETPEQRAVRLRRMSEYAAKRLSRETSEQRAKRLARMSEYSARRLAKETPEQRQARLARMSEYAAKRHARKKKLLKQNNVESFNLPHSVNNLMNNDLPDQI